MTMNKKKYISTDIRIIDMKTYDIMEIQGESRFRVDNGDEIKIIQDDLPEGFEVDAKLHDVDLWADEEPIEDVFK